MNGRWDLSFLYHSFQDPRIEQDLEQLNDLIDQGIEALKAIKDDKTLLETAVDMTEGANRLAEKLYSYAGMNMAADAKNEDAARLDDRLQPIMNKLNLLNSALVRRVGAIEDLEAVIDQSESLRSVAFALREMADRAKHTMPEAVEPWVLKMSLSGGSAFSRLRDQLDSTHSVPYHGENLPLSAVRGLAYDPDAVVRKDAYEAEIAAYPKMELPMAACLNSIKMEARTLSELRGYDSVLDMTLDDSRMDRRTLDAMWTAVREYLPHFRRYMKAKGKLLGHPNGLPFYDLFAPVGSVSMRFTIEEARAKLLTEMGKFSPEMAAFIDHAFEADWIDLYPRDGKSGGAFCSGAHQYDRSMVLTNFQGSFSDVSTLAHELGHGWHNRCTAGLPYMMIDIPMPLAETASIFNETTLAHQVLSSCKPEEEITLLEGSLMEATQTVVDIYSRFLFEQEVIDTRADHAMSVDELKDAMLRAQDAAYGDGLDAAYRHPYMWACKSHYYSSGYNFYNFPYAFGLLFGKGVFAKYLAEGPSFVPTYNKLLRSCGSDTVANVAASVGIDVRSADFWRSSLEIIKKEIDRFCELADAAFN